MPMLPNAPHSRVRLFLDSGAFSIWRKQFFELKKPVEERQELAIDLDEYIEAIRHLGDHIFVAVNLDVIPGSFSRKPTAAEVDESAAAGWKNLERMQAAGVRVMPVFHQGENFKWLTRMVDAGFDYVGISPANDVAPKGRADWLSGVFDHIVNDAGEPVVRTHGFGVTTPRLMASFPWFSVDSASAALHAAYGGVVLPHFNEGDDLSFESGQAIFFSSRARDVSLGGQVAHYHTLGKSAKVRVDRYLDEQGFTVAQLADDSQVRARLNIRFYQLFLAQHQTQPFRAVQRKFFCDGRPYSSRAGKLEPLSIFYGFSLNQHSAEMLDGEGCYDRLISFIHFRSSKQVDKLKVYLQTGKIPGGRRNGADAAAQSA